MKILIVEDDVNSRIVLLRALLSQGYAIESAGNGVAALQIVQETPIDLIISDILMPEMDGYTLCRALQADEQLKKIPFIFYTATYTDADSEKLAMAMGARRFLLKPMDLPELFAVIKEVLAEGPQQGGKEKHGHDQLDLDKEHLAALTRKLDKKVRELEEERQRLEHSEQKYRRLVEALREHYFFYAHDAQGIGVYISPSISNVLGYLPEEMMGHYSEHLTDSPINKEVVRLTEYAIKGDKQPPYEVEIFHKDGTIRRLEVTEEPVFDDQGQVVAVEGIAHDITRRIQTEAELLKAQQDLLQAQKMEAIGTLAGGIAHDFNNILSAILGFTDLALMRIKDDAALHDDLMQVRKAGDRATDLVRQILTFSRKQPQEKNPLQISSIIKEALKLLRSSIPSTIEIRQDINSQAMVLADPTQIHQMIMNLCTNAFHAMLERGGVMGVTLQEMDIDADGMIGKRDLSPGRYVVLTVSDSGCGMDKEVMAKMFEPYFTTKEKGKGTGLGLAVVHGIVKDHHGQIAVYSEPGKGTAFNVYLPMILQATEVDVVEEAPLPMAKGHQRIMIVDDESAIRDLATRILTEAGYRVETFANGIDAWRAFSQAPDAWDLLLTDQTMPGMTGKQLIAKALAIRPSLPIILCSGYSEIMNRTQAQTTGGYVYLQKPVAIRDLLIKVAEAFNKTE
ncbi:MAG: response regulator [Deltaproteobacteria bacterium]|nr:response regulator [Deltaproteobacteria bacterium]